MVNFALGESGSLTLFKDKETFRRMISQITSTDHIIVDETPSFASPSKAPSWYLLAQDDIGKVYHRRIIWIDQENNLIIHTMYLGNTTDWIESDYSEKEAVASTKLRYPDLVSAIKILQKKFPLEAERLRSYEKIIADTAERHAVNLHLTCEGGEAVAQFSIEGVVRVMNQDTLQFSDALERTLLALGEALKHIRKYEANLRPSVLP